MSPATAVDHETTRYRNVMRWPNKYEMDIDYYSK